MALNFDKETFSDNDNITNSFLEIQTPEDLADYIKENVNVLKKYAFPGKRIFYSILIIPKKDHSPRLIEAPCNDLKRILRKITDQLTYIYQPPACVHGFVCSKNVATNARPHVNKYFVSSFDIKNFFPSISAKRVRGLFKNIFFYANDNLIDLLTNLVTLHKHLPQGYPTSPIISNMICLQMDKQITKYCKEKHLFYSRYADDITISGNSKQLLSNIFISSKVEDLTLCPDFSNIIEDNGFSLNPQKTHISFKSDRQTVTQIIVNKKCNMPREVYRSFRVLFYNWEKKGWQYAANEYMKFIENHYCISFRNNINHSILMDEDFFKKHIRGRLAYYTMIDAQNSIPSTSLAKLWEMYLQRTEEHVPMSLIENNVFQLEITYDYEIDGKSNNFTSSSTGFLTEKGLFTCVHGLKELNLKYDIPENTNVEVACLNKSLSRKFPSQIPIKDFLLCEEDDIAFYRYKNIKPLSNLVINFNYLPQISEHVTGYGIPGGETDVYPIEAIVDSFKLDKSCVRITPTFYKGMSGGPVLNARQEVIGIILEGSYFDDLSRCGLFIRLLS